MFAVVCLRFIPGTNIHSAHSTTKKVLAVRVVGDPARNGGIEDTVVPGIDVDCETILVDSSSVGLYTPVVVFVQVKLEV